MTRFRERLPRLRHVERDYAREMIAHVARRAREFERTLGTRFAWLADEWYCLAERAYPGRAHYEDFPQLEDGIGTVRIFLEDAKAVNWSGDEQPLEAAAMADAHAAWHEISGDPASLSAIERAWGWVLGDNRLGEPLVDLESGAGFDGLGPRNVNRNRGAESTIAVHRCANTYAAVASMTAPPRNGVSRISVHA
jgi:hypothetical protein